MAPQVERLSLETLLLGEGPHWDVDKQTLYYVDILGSSLVRYTPGTKQYAKVSVAPKRPSFIIPVAGKENQFVISLSNEIAVITWDGESDEITIDEVLYTATETEKITFNDGKCDSTGRLWTGTLELNFEDLEKMPAVGNLYSIDSTGQIEARVNNIRLSNGLAFNPKINKLYYIDSLKRTVDQFELNAATGSLANREVLFSLSKNSIPGIPDGMAIDTNGNLWIAVFDGARVIRIDGSKPETLLQTIDLPESQVTSVIWGGKNLDELYVTAAAPFEPEAVNPSSSENGAIYKITNTGSRGLPGVNFKWN